LLGKIGNEFFTTKHEQGIRSRKEFIEKGITDSEKNLEYKNLKLFVYQDP
jgi:hypothetical protein